MSQTIYKNQASTDELRKVFFKYASLKKNDNAYMTSEDFVRKFVGLFEDTEVSHELVKFLAGIADTNNDGIISFAEFQAFETLLCSPDALYMIVFQLFDRNGKGFVSHGSFADVIKKMDLQAAYPFNLDGTFIKQYFGSEKERLNNYSEFTQLLNDFRGEYTAQAFRSRDTSGSGFISIANFQDIIVNLKRRALTHNIKNNLLNVNEGRKVSFPYFRAFTSLLDNIDLVKRVYLDVSKGSRTKQITKDELLQAAQTMDHVSPLEIDILFQLMMYTRKDNAESVTHADLCNITPVHKTPINRSIFIQVLESGYRFLLGGIAGAIGAAVVYPIDLVKTRMQNQRIDLVTGKIAYRNSFHCFAKVIQNEGAIGLYRGLPTQLTGIMPEKAIKLTVNDFVRGKLTDVEGNITMPSELFAGYCAGCCQVVITNPLEIVKIRLQTAGEIAGSAKVDAFSVIRELGITGLYKGSRACILRDSAFTGIYFPVYSHTKSFLANKDGYNNPLSLLAAGAIAGIPASSLVTPADVIKTRLQVVARDGETVYKGIWDAAKKIMKEEGPTAFWKGTGARVVRSSPQFGVTLITYELLQRFFYIDFGGSQPTGSQVKTSIPIDESTHAINPDHIGGYKRVVPVLNSIESRFGLCLPRFGKRTI